jgi:hypothetical protein
MQLAGAIEAQKSSVCYMLELQGIHATYRMTHYLLMTFATYNLYTW